MLKSEQTIRIALRRGIYWPWHFIVMVAVLGLVVAAVVVASSGGTSKRDDTVQVPLVASSADLSYQIAGDGWSIRASSSQLRASQIIIALTSSPAGEDGAVFVDKSSGAIVGKAALGPAPYAAIRTATNELLLSDLAEDGGRLLIFSTSGALSLRQEIPLTDRIQGTVYSPGMAVSADERFLYYLKHGNDCTPPSVGCDFYGVGVIDLDLAVEVTDQLLPANCGFGLLSDGLSASGVKVLCPNTAAVVAIDPTGSAVLARFPGVAPSRIDSTPAVRPFLADIDANNRWFILLSDGTVSRSDGSQTKLRLPSGGHIHWAQIYAQPGGTYLLGIANYGGNAANELAAIITFDAKKGQFTHTTMLAKGARFFLPEEGGNLHVLGKDGVLRLNTTASQTLRSTLIEAGAYALISAR